MYIKSTYIKERYWTSDTQHFEITYFFVNCSFIYLMNRDVDYKGIFIYYICAIEIKADYRMSLGKDFTESFTCVFKEFSRN